MSELVEKVAREIKLALLDLDLCGDIVVDYSPEARAAIKAVAEWSMSNYYAETSILRLWTEVLAQLEDKT